MVQESSNIRSFIFEDKMSLVAEPGQFVMVWLPDVGEFPMSVSLSYRGKSSIVVKAMGNGSQALYNCKVGDKLGIRGPYGKAFTLSKDYRKVLLVGGGTGIAPILKIAEKLSKQSSMKVRAEAVTGARTGPEIPFLSTLGKMLGPNGVHPSTDDGTVGFKGFAHEQVQVLVNEKDFDMIYCCGPEAMMLRVFEIATKSEIPAQFSLERIMKCGIAICGSCCIQDLVLCRDGPVLDDRILRSIAREFGRFERDKTGTLVAKSAGQKRL